MGRQPATWGAQPTLATFLLLLNSGAETSLRWLLLYKLELQTNLFAKLAVPYDLCLMILEEARNLWRISFAALVLCGDKFDDNPMFCCRNVQTKYGPVQGVLQQPADHLQPVATFLGIPFATPPLGNLRSVDTKMRGAGG